MSSEKKHKTRYFVLLHGRVLPAANAKAWAAWYRSTPVKDRLIDHDEVHDVDVVTSFVGLGFSGKPCVYQTVLFGGPADGEVIYSNTRDEAAASHRYAVARAHRTTQ